MKLRPFLPSDTCNTPRTLSLQSCQQAAELRDNVSVLHTTREDEGETTDSLRDPTARPPAPSCNKATASTHPWCNGVTAGEGEGWKLVLSGTGRKAPAPPKGLQLQNRFTTLKAEEEPDMLSSTSRGPQDLKSCKMPGRKR